MVSSCSDSPFSWKKNFPEAITPWGVRVATFYDLPGIPNDYVNITQRDGAARNPILVIPFVELLSRILPGKLESMQIQWSAVEPGNSTTSVMSSDWATPSVNPATPS
jgi:hypothetical protein